jgi:hypothetical protein
MVEEMKLKSKVYDNSGSSTELVGFATGFTNDISRVAALSNSNIVMNE